MDDEAIRRGLAERLRCTRLSLGLTQEELAERLGIPRVAISEIESNKRGVTIPEYLRYCQVIHARVGPLLAFAVDNQDSRLDTLGTIMERLSTEQRAAVYLFACFLDRGGAPLLAPPIPLAAGRRHPATDASNTPFPST